MDDEKRLAYIERQLKVLPDNPGVYLIFDDNEEVLYVGKAKNLSNRVRSHFTKSTDFSKSRVIRERGVRIEVHQVKTENEALLLEYNMIQEHQPPLNDKWKDGKTYPYLEVTTGEQFPRFVMTRDRDNPDSIYLGPYSDVGAVKRSLKFVLNHFPVADCRKEIHLGDADGWAKTCIRRRTKQCMRPCEIEVDVDEYNENVEQVINFMEGKLPDVIDDAESKMQEAASNLEFEKAAKYRDIVSSIQRTMERQHVFLDGIEDGYIVVEQSNKTEKCITVQKIEDGRIVRRDSNTISSSISEEKLIEFTLDFLVNILNLSRDSTPDMTKLIVETSHPDVIMDKMEAFGFVPIRATSSVDRQLVDMTKNHAKRFLQRRLLVRRDRRLPSRKVNDLGTILGLELPPHIIDTFDVSTLMGTNTVAACVRFQDGKPLKKGYRRFKIRSVDHQDDFASMEEVVSRRYYGVEDGVDQKGLPIPDLIVIDGGPEQLKRAKNALDNLELHIPLVALAKREEEIYLIEAENPIREDKNREGMLLIRACRDEAHRFAVKYQRKLRQQEGLVSILDEIHGIGSKRRKKLLKLYKTVSSIAKESSETLASKVGISQDLASTVIDACRKFTTKERDFSKRSRRRRS